jgi:hypothetical protein
MKERFRDEFIPSVRDWCERHADKVSKCYASLHQGYPSVFVIGAHPKRNGHVLGPPLADLDLNLKRSGWNCNVTQIPKEHASHYDAFLEAEAAVLVYGEAK